MTYRIKPLSLIAKTTKRFSAGQNHAISSSGIRRSKTTECSKVPFKIIYLLIKTLCLNCAFFVQSLYESGVGMDKANNPYSNMQSCFEKLVDMRGYLSKNEDEITEVKL